MKLQQLRNSGILLITSIIWGVAFVAQSKGTEFVGPFTFVFSRFIIAAFALLPVAFFVNRGKAKKENLKVNIKTILFGGIFCGLFLGTASVLQQIGIEYTTVGKAGFITALYIIFVPIIGIVFNRKNSPLIWVSVLIAVAGLYFLCITDTLSIEQGDIFIMLCALVFSGHILIVDYFSPKVDGILLSCLQFFTIGILAFIPMMILEKPSFSTIIPAWQPILYAGLLSSAVGYTLQIVGQKDLNPTIASLIMSLESVVSVIAGLLLLGQELSQRELIGCILMFIAIVLAQLPSKKDDFNTNSGKELEKS